jgi:membrane protease YdiL (CAAX protease family)
MSYFISISFVVLIMAVVVGLNERFTIFSSDRFATAGHRVGSYLWLGVMLAVIASLVAGASSGSMSAAELKHIPFWSLFTLHLLLLIFLAGWWLLTGRPPLRQFLNLRGDTLRSVMIGLTVGVAGWAITIAAALSFALLLQAVHLMPEHLEPSPMIPWMAALPFWRKATIVFTAMTVEEAFFRGWLQKRVGLIPSTILFALGHAGYGQPFMLFGVTVVSLIIGMTFYRTRNLLPCIIAHGVFDAIQLFVIVPVALKLMPV